jgi:ribosomal protein L11 methyltransferase
MASKLGATSIEAIDIEEESYQNTLENARINRVENVIARKGDLSVVQNGPFDGILANINRHIILDSLPRLAALCRPGGWLLISGILVQDESIVLEAAEASGFSRVGMETRGNWICMHLLRS